MRKTSALACIAISAHFPRPSPSLPAKTLWGSSRLSPLSPSVPPAILPILRSLTFAYREANRRRLTDGSGKSDGKDKKQRGAQARGVEAFTGRFVRAVGMLVTRTGMEAFEKERVAALSALQTLLQAFQIGSEGSRHS